MLQLKEYQQRSLDVLQAFFRDCTQFGDAGTAFYRITSQVYGQGIPYIPVSELPGLPYVCLRIPTGGGKTLVACHTIGITSRELLHSDNSVVLWLVPSNAIRDQTLNALKDRSHPYRQALEAENGSVNVLNISEAHYVQPSVLNSDTTIVTSTIQAFRVDDTEGRKVYEDAGALMSHFTSVHEDALEGLERYPNDTPIRSLANVLRLHRPLIIVDEAHNARTPLSFETLARFNPSCIIEFTATPDTEDNPSNVLHSVSAAELKTEEMIKLPICLETRPQWKELLADAVAKLAQLEAIAKQERQVTGEYIRPIMLLQAQPHYQVRDTITVDVVESTLLEDHNIPAEQIARATGSDRELEGIDLFDPACPIRYVITIQALREGWDCPFAYVLCSVAELRSSTAVEQILGRVLRMPRAKRKQHTELNLAYAFAASQNFAEAANQLADALVQNGFERQEARDLISGALATQPDFGSLFEYQAELSKILKISVAESPDLGNLSPETAFKVQYDPVENILTFKAVLEESELYELKRCFQSSESQKAVEWANRSLQIADGKTPAERGDQFSIPALAIKQGDFLDQFDETHFLEYPWELSKCDASLSEEDLPSQRPRGQEWLIDITDTGRVQTRFISDLHHQMTLLSADQGWTVPELVYWLDRYIPHIDITPDVSGIFLSLVVQTLIDERGFSLDQLVQDKYRLKKAVEAKIDQHRKRAHNAAYQQLLLPDNPTPLVVSPEICFSFDPDPSNYPYSRLYKGHFQFQKHYYPQVGDLGASGEELECAKFIDLLPEVMYWVRNLERRPSHAFWLQTSTDKFYPDFVCMLNDDRYMVVEYKGEHLWGNPDSQEKRNIGELWDLRSSGQCLFIMPNGPDYEAVRAKIFQ